MTQTLDEIDLPDEPDESELVDEEITDSDEEDEVFDLSYAPVDDRYEGQGIPNWSSFA